MSIIERWRRNIRIEANRILAQQEREIIAKLTSFTTQKGACFSRNIKRRHGSIWCKGKLAFHYNVDGEGKATIWW